MMMLMMRMMVMMMGVNKNESGVKREMQALKSSEIRVDV